MPHPSTPAEVSHNINENIFQKRFLPAVQIRGGGGNPKTIAEKMQTPPQPPLCVDLGLVVCLCEGTFIQKIDTG